jgi:hypothetical protein
MSADTKSIPQIASPVSPASHPSQSRDCGVTKPLSLASPGLCSRVTMYLRSKGVTSGDAEVTKT